MSEHTGATASTYLAPELRKVVAELVADISGRIQHAQNELDFLVVERLRFAARPEASFVVRLHPSLSVVADRLASAVQLCGQRDYQAYAHRINAISKVRWTHDRQNPLGADVLARAYLACLTDCLDTPEKRSIIEPLLLGENARSLFNVLMATDDFMDALSIDAAPAEPAIQFGRSLQSPKQPTVDRASIEQVFAPKSPEIQDTQPSDESFQVPPKRAPAQVANAQTRVQRVTSRARVADSFSAPHQLSHAQDSDGSALQAAIVAGVIRPEVAGVTAAGSRLGDYTAVRTIERIEDNALRFAHQAGEQAHSKQARRRYFEAVREQLRAEQCPPSQLSIVDLVAAMFDLVIDDLRMPENLRPLVWRLQQPALLLSLLDPGYLGDHPRSVRALLENLGALAAEFGAELTRDSDLFRRIETLVRAVEIISARLADRSRALAQEVEKEFDQCATGMAQLIERLERDRRSFDQAPGQINRRDFSRRPARDEERRVSEHLRAQIADRTAGRALPQSVLVFLDSVWLRYMRTTLLREGANSASFKNAEQVIDDLLWTLDGQTGAGNRRQLAQRIPTLIEQVNLGMSEVSAKEQDHQAFFDELFLIHLRKLQRLPGEHPPTARASENDSASGNSQTAGISPSPEAESSASDESQVPVLRTPVKLSESETAMWQPTAPATVSIVGPVTEGAGRLASNDDHVSAATIPLGGNRLLSVLQEIDLADLPAQTDPSATTDSAAIDAMACGDWLEYRQSNGQRVNLKVAWLSDRRSVALLVRHPDRRAMSKPMSRLKKLMRSGRLRLLRAEHAA
ncbi:MAG: DUF1631 family protein [Burkholderiaceae bacterium]